MLPQPAPAKTGGMDRQRLWDWVHRFNAEGPEGLIDRKAPGRAAKLNWDQKARLAALVDRGPIPAVHEVVRRRCKDLVRYVWEEYCIEISEKTISRVPKELGFRRMTARASLFVLSFVPSFAPDFSLRPGYTRPSCFLR